MRHSDTIGNALSAGTGPAGSPPPRKLIAPDRTL
jgi:hypothetical protein